MIDSLDDLLKVLALVCLCDLGGYLWPPSKSTWTSTIVSFSFSDSLVVA